MNSSQKFPSDQLVENIKQQGLPKFTSDISQFSGKSEQEIADWAMKQDQPVVLNVSNATNEELSNFTRANAILSAEGKPQITLFDQGEVINQLSGDLTTETLTETGARHYRHFIQQILKKEDEGRQLVQTEYGEFILDPTRIKSFEEHHFWQNLGLEDQNDPRRLEVTKLLESIASEEDFIRVTNEVIEICGDHPLMDREQTRLLIGLAFASNFVRGHLYNILNPDKVGAYEPRKIAVESSAEINPLSGSLMSQKKDPDLSDQPSAEELQANGYRQVGFVNILELRDNEAYHDKIPDLHQQNIEAEDEIKRAKFVYKVGSKFWIKN